MDAEPTVSQNSDGIHLSTALDCVFWNRIANRVTEVQYSYSTPVQFGIAIGEKALSFIKVVGITVTLITLFYCYLVIGQ